MKRRELPPLRRGVDREWDAEKARSAQTQKLQAETDALSKEVAALKNVLGVAQPKSANRAAPNAGARVSREGETERLAQATQRNPRADAARRLRSFDCATPATPSDPPLKRMLQPLAGLRSNSSRTHSSASSVSVGSGDFCWSEEKASTASATETIGVAGVGSLCAGSFDEETEARAFRDAVGAWRQGAKSSVLSSTAAAASQSSRPMSRQVDCQTDVQTLTASAGPVTADSAAVADTAGVLERCRA